MSDAAAVLVPAKIGPVHLGRDAYVYVRQSTLTQLREHTESLIRQYELRERAVALGLGCSPPRSSMHWTRSQPSWGIRPGACSASSAAPVNGRCMQLIWRRKSARSGSRG